MLERKLRVVTFLAPNMLDVYEYVIDYVGRRLGLATDLITGTEYEETFDADLSFICGLPYVLRTAPYLQPSPIEALVAPVLQGERYQGKPIYFSDVIVKHDSPFQTFDDLRGHSWAFNEPESQSGYGITLYSMVARGLTAGFFGEVVEAGFHQKAIQMVAAGDVDASAIDSQVLAVELRDQPGLAEKLRIIDAFGPSTIQPLAVSTQISHSLRDDMRSVLVELHNDPEAKAQLARGFIERLVPVSDSDYDDIRQMYAACEKADFLTIR